MSFLIPRQVAALLRTVDIDAIWNEANERERKLLVNEIIEAVIVHTDRLQVTINGAPPLTVALSEVGLREPAGMRPDLSEDRRESFQLSSDSGGARTRHALRRAGRASSLCTVSAKSALLSEVLALPAEERVEIVAELLASLDDGGTGEDSDELDAIWAAEMSRRSQQLASGEVQAETWEHVLRRVAEGRQTR